MFKRAGVLGLVLLWCGMAGAANDSGSAAVRQHGWAVGYDEGLAGKFYFTNQISAGLSIGYMVTGADAVYKQPMNLFLLKIGGQYLLKDYRKARVSAFLDFVGTMKEGQIAYTTRTGPNKVYYQWITSARLGLAPEIFVTDKISLTYKFGLQLTNFGNTYKLNADESATERNKDNYVQAGVYGFQSDSPFMLLHNIALLVYFKM